MASSLATLDRIAPRASRAAAYICAAGVAGPIAFHAMRGSQAHLGLFEDDFYYYVVLADHLVRFGRLTFDGVTLTNGVHPLWFGVVLLLRMLSRGVGVAFFSCIALVLFGAMVATYEALRSFATSLGARPSVAAPIAALQGIAVNQIIASGMEVAIAIPLYVWLLALVARGAELTPARAARFGVVVSLAVLARLDVAVAAVLIVVGWLLVERPLWRTSLRLLAAFSVGASGLLVYLAVNRALFGSFMPISALAKQLRTGIGPNPGYLHSLLFDTVYGNRAVPALILGVVLLLWPIRVLSRPAQLAAAVSLAFPVAFYATQMVFTNWVLFPWYTYPLVPAVVTTLVLAWDRCVSLVPARAHLAAATVVLGFAVLSAAGRGVRFFVQQGPEWSVSDNTMTAMDFELARRLRGYKGRFAMGDKAAGAAFILDRPIVQLEGLVEDRSMIEHLRRQDSLAGFADEYAIDYLIVSVGATRLERQDGCYVVTHPNVDQAGPSSLKSRTRICAEPLIHFQTPRGARRWSRWLALETYVFDISTERRRALGS